MVKSSNDLLAEIASEAKIFAETMQDDDLLSPEHPWVVNLNANVATAGRNYQARLKDEGLNTVSELTGLANLCRSALEKAYLLPGQLKANKVNPQNRVLGLEVRYNFFFLRAFINNAAL